MTSEPDAVESAAAAARSTGRLAVDGEQIPVFDLRAATDSTAQDGAAGGCLLIGRRGTVRVALLVD